MQRSTLIGLKIGLLALLAFIAAIGMSVNAPASQWLKEAFLGLSFSFGFGLGLPDAVAYVATILVFVAIFSAGYFVGNLVVKKLEN
ncbi:hypothetical protein [Enterovibrio nigricans]|uniref:Uncharacterized protein n=1 Tax=Enterovibrio nigricans DSM 22720 TaxID=1121868 RepID=A0A1T4UG09_9GAMM|nr:hypothetical protein [Enterovibrio nigricans]PKF51089.1 hypothetical protein AT251_06720 [Enterovibrio nigricans]SKA51629.1 hypothetical protein SAMN02745132_01659 [Enterovibrio nigricans DSM 22720]